MDLPHYHNLEWRVDVQLASRGLQRQAEPSVLLRLHTRDGGVCLCVCVWREFVIKVFTSQCLQSLTPPPSPSLSFSSPPLPPSLLYPLPPSLSPLFFLSLSSLLPPLLLLLSPLSDSSQCHLLQTDPVNLLHLTQSLESALGEINTQHCRRIMRNIK